MASPLISVILPTYNVELYLKKCLDSILCQSYQNLEILIIDDASTDRTPQIIKEYTRKDHRIKSIFHRKNCGPGSSRNEGLSLATGDYITFMDHDDWQDPKKYEVMLQKALETSTDIVFCNAYEYNESSKKNSVLFYIPKKRHLENVCSLEKDDLKYFFLNRYFPPWCKLIKKTLINRSQMRFSEENNMFDDVFFHYQLILSAKTVTCINLPLYTHRFFPGSLSERREKKPDMYFDDFKTWNDIDRLCKEKGFDRKAIFANYLMEIFPHHCIVKSSGRYVKKLQSLCREIEMESYDFSFQAHKLVYKKLFKLSPRKILLKKIRRKLFRFHFKPKKGEFHFTLLGLRLI